MNCDFQGYKSFIECIALLGERESNKRTRLSDVLGISTDLVAKVHSSTQQDGKELHDEGRTAPAPGTDASIDNHELVHKPLNVRFDKNGTTHMCVLDTARVVHTGVPKHRQYSYGLHL